MANDLGVMDFLAIAFMLILSWSVGIYYGFRDSKSASGDKTKLARYVLGNYKMAVLPVAFSLAVTTVSGSLMVGVVGEVYLYGVQYIFFAVGGLLGLVISGFVVIPVYRKIKYVSIYEYLERRYDRTMRLFFSVVYILAKMIFSSVALYVPAICISTLTDVPQWVSIAVAGLVCVCYCVSGGIKAVIWTDVIQAFFMILCNCLIIVLGTARVGGLQNVWNANVEGNRIWHITLIEDAHTRYSIWSLVFGALIVYMNAMSAGQAAGQRILSVRGLRQAQSATFLGGLLIFSLISVIIWTGVVIFANVSACDPLLHPEISRVKTPDQILIYGMAQILEQPGLKGLALAGIFSGSLSTFSSYINSFATLTMEDFIRPALKKHGKILTDNKSLVLCKFLTCIYGFICIILAFLVPFMGGVIKAGIQITGATGGPLLAVIFLGVFTRTANKRGVLLGLIFGLSFNLWLSVGSTLHKTRFTTLPLTDHGCPTVVNATDWQLITPTSNATTRLPSDVSTPSPSFSLGQVNDTEVEFTDNSHSVMSDLFPFYNISFMWQGPIGFVLTLLMGYITSRIINLKTTKPNEIDPRLLSDWVKTHAEKIVIGSFERVSTCTPLCDVSSSSKSEDEKLKDDNVDSFS